MACAPQHLLRPLLFGFFIAGVVWTSWKLDLPHHMSVDGMRALVDSHAPYGALVFMAVIVLGICTRVPMLAQLLIAVGGVLFGGLLAFAYGWVASLIGTTVTFLLVRFVARDYVERALSGRLARFRALDDRLARNGFWTVFVLRLVGVLAPPLNWGLGLTGVRLRHYVAGTALGIVPGLAITVFFADAIANGTPGSGVLSLGIALDPVLVLRSVAVLAFGGPILMGWSRRRRETRNTSGDGRGSRLPLVANLAGFSVFFPLLIVAAGGTEGSMALLLSITGGVVAVAGCAVVLKSRAELGAAWNFVPKVGEQSGFVTTGPYRLVRHPMYLGLSMLAAGEAIAFSNVPALLVVLAAVIPSFLWRARVEEDLLIQVFGDRYLAYQERTEMVVPYLL
jgi:uncharacterized membrane protein YdjX (TVP38/TMEM64 family)/isoprenylcysteine carboxyl methyltransferase (ICMT) family protein YpbQ